MRLRRTLLALLAAAVAAPALLVPPDTAAAAEGAPGVRPGGFRIEAAEGTTLTVPGLGRFTDTIEVLPAPDGRLQVVNELSLDAYVEGIAEMPASWPLEALKAQAVAARTYAWYAERRGFYLEQGLDFDICATTACQVFRGREVVELPGGAGQRWADAVAATAGEVLVWEDRPILARYFSTSGGATRDNADVFPRSGPRPYLQGVEDPDDAVSPMSRWQVRFTRAEFDAILARGETLSAAVPVADVRRVLADGTSPDRIELTRADGHVVRIDAATFRSWVSEQAPQLFPGRFPQRRADGGPMPATLLSSRIDFEVTPDAVVVHGRGWGHGVGMGQYGAKGKAERGLTAEEILAAYYGGLEPAPHDRAPERIRVGLTWDATQVEVRADGYVRVLTDTGETDARSTIPWVFRAAGRARVELVTGPPAPFGPRQTPSRRLPRLPERSADPAADAGATVPSTDATPPPSGAVPDGDTAAPADDPDASLAATLGDTLTRTVPGIGLARVLRDTLRALRR